MIFSVIVPFLNEEPCIEKCITCLLDQDFDKREYELIFIDNGSKDKSAKIVRKFPEVTLLQENKKCAYAARNKGLKIAKGEIVAFTDADCAVSKDWLTRIYEGMKENSAGIILGKCLFSRNGSNLLRFFENYENAKAEYVLNTCPKRYFFGYTRNMAVKAELFKSLGTFVVSPILGDTEFVQRYASQNPAIKNVVYLNDMKITHMEIASLRSWLKKISGYGKYSRHENMVSYRPLDYKIKLEISNSCVKNDNYTLLEKLIFFFLLIIGDVVYKTGRIRGYIKSLFLRG